MEHRPRRNDGIIISGGGVGFWFCSGGAFVGDRRKKLDFNSAAGCRCACSRDLSLPLDAALSVCAIPAVHQIGLLVCLSCVIFGCDTRYVMVVLSLLYLLLLTYLV